LHFAIYVCRFASTMLVYTLFTLTYSGWVYILSLFSVHWARVHTDLFFPVDMCFVLQ
jgi:hypothetical protein